jgi:FkbM family methyltransferase
MLLRFVRELVNVWRICRPGLALRYYLAVLACAPQILRERKLYAADRRITGRIEYRLLGRWIPLDLSLVPGGYPFAFVREFAGRNAYFRSFVADRLTFDTCLDAGANNGLVAEALSRLGGDRNRVLAVEALHTDTPYWPPLLERRPNITLVGKALVGIGSGDGGDTDTGYLRLHGDGAPLPTVNVPDLLAEHGIARIGFLKVDIEGGEFALLRGGEAWLDRVDNIAMEAHRHEGDVAALVETLRRAGFAVAATDDFGGPVAPAMADYIYASRTGALNPALASLPPLAV